MPLTRVSKESFPVIQFPRVTAQSTKNILSPISPTTILYLIPLDNPTVSSTNYNSSMCASLFPYSIPTSKTFSSYYYPIHHRLSQHYLANLVQNQDNQINFFRNHFINLITNPFTTKEESYYDLIKGKSKEEWINFCTRKLGNAQMV